MVDLDLDEGKNRGLLRLSFSTDAEAHYRDFLRTQSRVPRTGLFLILALGFGLAPFYQQLLFRPTDTVLPLLIILECFCILPIALLAAAVSYYPAPRLLTQTIQSAAVLIIFFGVIVFRHLALIGEM